MPRVVGVEREPSGELKGQTSINGLLDAAPVQLALPMLVQVKPGQFRRVS